jgi:hypothetical protein
VFAGKFWAISSHATPLHGLAVLELEYALHWLRQSAKVVCMLFCTFTESGSKSIWHKTRYCCPPISKCVMFADGQPPKEVATAGVEEMVLEG